MGQQNSYQSSVRQISRFQRTATISEYTQRFRGFGDDYSHGGSTDLSEENLYMCENRS